MGVRSTPNLADRDWMKQPDHFAADTPDASNVASLVDSRISQLMEMGFEASAAEAAA